MTVKELLEHKEFILCIGSDSEKEFSSRGILIKVPEEITSNSEIQLDYYWYNHGSQVSRSAIQEALRTKNWTEFSKFYFDENCPCTLPTSISASCGEFYFGELSICEETFNLITFFEDEHG